MATNDSGLAFKRWGRTQPFMKYGIPMISVTVFALQKNASEAAFSKRGHRT